MIYDGIIDKSIKEEAKRVLQLSDNDRETKTICIEMVSKIISAIQEKMKPFDANIKEVLVKYDLQNECQVFQANKALSEISITRDIEAENLIDKLMCKYNNI